MFTTIDVVGLQRRGQDLYKHKEYKAAVEYFNIAISHTCNPSIELYDNRAATLLRLGDLPTALRDARRMIHAEKAQSMGYLRTGQVLQLMGKEEVALEIYKYGMQKVSVMDSNYKVLRSMHDKLVAKHSPPKLVDPLLLLPLEVVEIILSHLDFNTKVSLFRVSPQWSKLVKSMPELWKDLDLAQVKKSSGIKAVESCVKWSKGTIVRAIIRDHRYDSRKHNILRYLFRQCKNINYVDIRGSPAPSSILLDAIPFAISLKTLITSHEYDVCLTEAAQILATCKVLAHAEFNCVVVLGNAATWHEDLSRLRVLKLKASGAYDSHETAPRIHLLNLNALFEKAPHLVSLILQFWLSRRQRVEPSFAALEQLEVLDLSNYLFYTFPQLPPSLKSLKLSGNHLMNFTRPGRQNNLQNTNLINLTSLSLSGFDNLTISDLERLLEPGKGKLGKLAITNSTLGVTDKDTALHICYLMEAGYLAHVVDLDLSIRAVDDNVAELLAKSLPRLTTVSLAKSKVTGVGVKALVLKQGDALQHLYLQYCTSVSVDAVEFARSKGVNVIFTFPDNLKYGKRVRLRS